MSRQQAAPLLRRQAFPSCSLSSRRPRLLLPPSSTTALAQRKRPPGAAARLKVAPARCASCGEVECGPGEVRELRRGHGMKAAAATSACPAPRALALRPEHAAPRAPAGAAGWSARAPGAAGPRVQRGRGCSEVRAPRRRRIAGQGRREGRWRPAAGVAEPLQRRQPEPRAAAVGPAPRTAAPHSRPRSVNM